MIMVHFKSGRKDTDLNGILMTGMQKMYFYFTKIDS